MLGFAVITALLTSTEQLTQCLPGACITRSMCQSVGELVNAMRCTRARVVCVQWLSIHVTQGISPHWELAKLTQAAIDMQPHEPFALLLVPPSQTLCRRVALRCAPSHL